MNTGKHFRREYSLANSSPFLQFSANLMQEMPFYFNLKFSVKVKESTLAEYLIKLIAHPFFM